MRIGAARFCPRINLRNDRRDSAIFSLAVAHDALMHDLLMSQVCFRLRRRTGKNSLEG